MVRNWLSLITAATLCAPVPSALAQPSRPPSEMRRTNPAEVVISDVRYRAGQSTYPSPPGSFAASGEFAPLCRDVEERVEAPQGTGYRLAVTGRLAQLAGVTAEMDDNTRRTRFAALYERLGDRTVCNTLQGGTLFRLGLGDDYFGRHFVDEVLLGTGVPLNAIHPVDGRTLLDFVADQHDQVARFPDSRAEGFKQIYGTLRRFGALHRLELERRGAVRAPGAINAEQIAAYQAEIRRGDTTNWGLLLSRLDDPAARREWFLLGNQAAQARGNWSAVSGIARFAIMGHRRDRPASTAPTPAEAREMLRAAIAAGNLDGLFWYGHALTQGIGGPVDVDGALAAYMRNPEDRDIARMIAAIYLSRGNRNETIRWLRYVAQTGGRLSAFGNGTVATWFESNGVSECGENVHGFDNCTPGQRATDVRRNR